MSEVDRLSNSGLYPALPIADRQRERDDSDGDRPRGSRRARLPPKEPTNAPPEASLPPRSGIDEYA